MVLKPEKEEEAEAIFRKWGLDFAVVGETTPTKRFVVAPRRRGRWPTCRSRSSATRRRSTTGRTRTTPKLPVIERGRRRRRRWRSADALLKLIGSPDLCSKRWVWEQYDHVILGNTVQRPGGDAAVVRVDGRPEGARAHLRRDAALLRGRSVRRRQAGGGGGLAQPHRRRRAAARASPTTSISAIRSGRRSWASSSAASAASREACRALDFPVVSGNVSLYNETNGRAILPTPTIGGVGLLDDFTKSATLAFKAAGEAILLIGETKGWLGQSLYLREICGREEGAPPPVDLAAERAQRRFRARADRATVPSPRCTTSPTAACGGARRDGDGVRHRRRARCAPPLAAHAFWFGEDQARYVVTVEAGRRRRDDGARPRRRRSGRGSSA